MLLVSHYGIGDVPLNPNQFFIIWTLLNYCILWIVTDSQPVLLFGAPHHMLLKIRVS